MCVRTCARMRACQVWHLKQKVQLMAIFSLYRPSENCIVGQCSLRK